MNNPNSYVDSITNIQKHLEKLKFALRQPDCQLDILPVKKGESETNPYTTAYTMLDLEYTSEDVKQKLFELTVHDYMESMKDSVKPDSNDFLVFGITINNRDVYVKVKLRREKNIFCISFHYAQYPFKKKPYN